MAYQSTERLGKWRQLRSTKVKDNREPYAQLRYAYRRTIETSVARCCGTNRCAYGPAKSFSRPQIS